MEITCHHCDGTGISPSTGQTCHVCGGDGDIETEGLHIHTIIKAHVITINTKFADLDTKIDAIAAQVQVLYDDLNP